MVLLEEGDFVSADRVRLSGRRAEHITAVLRSTEGDRLRVGQLNGRMGSGVLRTLETEAVELQVSLDQEPPTALPVTLLLALPRPKMLKRVLQTITSFGVKQIYLLNSYRVEKSFWTSPVLQPERIREQLLLGLEQACDTFLPEVHLRKRFKPFVEDELPGLCRESQALVAHPAAGSKLSFGSSRRTTLAIGPEGGFIPYEIEKLQVAGFTPVSLGERILRVEAAVPALLSRLLPS